MTQHIGNDRGTDRKLGRPRRAALCAAGLGLTLVLGACGDEGPTAAPSTTEPGETAFATLDGNGDSYLDSDEIAEWVDEPGTFEEWDADADSELDYDEIAGNAFEKWDRDDDGTLTQYEWKRGVDFWYPLEKENVTFGDWDGDGDSELDADEFREAFDSSAAGETWKYDRLDKKTFKTAYFELYDRNDDGKVSETEFEQGASVFGTARE